MYAFDDQQQRARWSNLPTGFVPRGGINLKQMTVRQREAAMKLATGLSPMGLEKVNQIRAAGASSSHPAILIDAIDSNHDGVFSESEKEAYALHVLGDLSISIDGKRLTPELSPDGAQRALVLTNHHRLRRRFI